MERAHRVSVELSIRYESGYACHCDRSFLGKVDLWRDLFPDDFGHNLASISPGETYTQTYASGILTPPFNRENLIRFPEKHFVCSKKNGHTAPDTGRFYPQGYGWRPLNCFPQNKKPFRIIQKEGGFLVADTNHPLSSYPMQLSAHLYEELETPEEHGGSITDIADYITSDGPGMQVPLPGTSVNFYSEYPFPRVNSNDDSHFYQTPRLVKHLDDTAIRQVELLHGRLLSPGWTILDLMSSWVSHLPATLQQYVATGLGMNREELRANPQLAGYKVHDLNNDPRLPFDDNTFDAVICTASVEYLIYPLEVMAEIARVLKPGGISLTTFSDRWFPGKEITIWPDLHPFERLGLILDYYIKSLSFDTLNTETIRGYPRPITDKHILKSLVSDPIFAVWGKISK